MTLPHLSSFRTHGSGTFQRQKMLLLHLVPEGCPGIKRARMNAKKPDVKRALGEVRPTPRQIMMGGWGYEAGGPLSLGEKGDPAHGAALATAIGFGWDATMRRSRSASAAAIRWWVSPRASSNS